MSKSKKESVSSPVDKKLSRKERNEQMVYDNWQSNRDMGKAKFIIKFGVLSWGIGTFVIYWFLMIVMNAILDSNADLNVFMFAFSLIFFVVFGLIYGNILWNRNEKLFKAKFPYGRKSKSK